MNNTLYTFYNNQNERETVKEFLISILKELAVERTFDSEDVKGIPEAKLCIDRAFDRLDELYGKKENKIISNSR